MPETIPVTVDGLKNLLALARKNGTVDDWVGVALQWAEQADNEIKRLEKLNEENLIAQNEHIKHLNERIVGQSQKNKELSDQLPALSKENRGLIAKVDLLRDDIKGFEQRVLEQSKEIERLEATITSMIEDKEVK